MKHVYIRKISRNENCVPGNLRDFLIGLEVTTTSEQVWDLIVDFAAGLGLPVVDYVFATDYQKWEQAQFIRTTLSSDWINFAQNDPDVRKLSTFRLHSVKYLTPMTVGYSYVDDIEGITPERKELLRRTAAAFHCDAGLAIPLRMNEPGQAAHLLVAGPYNRDEFDAILKEHGWAIHAAALSAHTRYVEFFKAEFCERNELTEKQKELVTLVGRGLLDKQIMYELGISFSAVRQRLSAVQAKTGSTNRAELAALAMRIGLVPDPMLKSHSSDLTVFLSTGDGKSGSERHDAYPASKKRDDA